MLREVSAVAQDIPGLTRRWFRDEYFDLYLWEGHGGEIGALQLCYDRSDKERSLRWSAEKGFLHEGVDRPETKPGRAMTAILVVDGAMPLAAVSRKLLAAAKELPAGIRDFLFARLEEYARGGRPPTPGGRGAPRHGGRERLE
ncbi:MAG TPA: hypothetical protein VFV55_03120 [Usitatibacteraceae bacterium]|nr:hypothetical protein [Usitatibacteraceae bacterium]